ncbi:MAG: hypothetical protein K2F79_07380, partial [Muribaculaceae bacterium]|nr:hypothetical protein [Muribaculaceae bacterium]
MKGLATLLATTLLPIGAQGITLGDIAERLASTACYADSCSYEVLLPNLSEPVIYSIKLQSAKAGAGDTLSPCRYMIDWSLKTPTG